MWTDKQCYRLAAEKELIDRYYPDFKFYNQTSKKECYIYGRIKSSQNNNYYIKICIPDFPYMCPKAYICYPQKLYDYDGTPLTQLGISHKMHLLKPSDDGCVQMCLYREERWSTSLSLIKILLKAGLWIEAYEAHLSTGKSIDNFVNTMK